ncbi:hypothetical protein RF11_15290 [Thelohanellus kitauei]|uniref:Uncharacterized protein n=1 Tax=Thelohanellus kitauei TaxID=669202 RepID=A0A0C2NDH1_THEKT|nr:hypothetical protein RF11_15290 [Thelohanellus kitauei]
MYREICVLKLLEFSMNPDFLLEGEGGHSKENSISTQPCFTDSGSELNSRNIFDYTNMDNTIFTPFFKFMYQISEFGPNGTSPFDSKIIVRHLSIQLRKHTHTIEGNWKHVRSHMPSTETRKWLCRSYLLEDF